MQVAGIFYLRIARITMGTKPCMGPPTAASEVGCVLEEVAWLPALVSFLACRLLRGGFQLKDFVVIILLILETKLTRCSQKLFLFRKQIWNKYENSGGTR